ncbi:hypothetical protein O3M35_004287 [Rhynocoris fuscipes]|uniref:Transmembrane protein 53 n=1 Tax=Rhynocoris fuscipes TaxID=488301 RepID=A0AAW1CIW9_9HEMI
MAFRNSLCVLVRNAFSTSAVYQAAGIGVTNSNKNVTSKQSITKHLELISSVDSNQLSNDIHTNKVKPLVVLLGWLLAKPQHMKKYSDIYMDRGYNVLTVSMTPWQFFWPTTGAQLIADELLNFLKNGPRSQPLLLHGFSIGAYLWGECLVKMVAEPSQYSHLIQRIKGQIWDSAPDIAELHKGLPMAIAPNNAILRRAAEKYFAYHLKTFHDVATQHYIRSSQLFHTTPVRAPSLIFVCKNDPIASYSSNKKVQESWDSMGMKTYLKCWEKSKHVSHIIIHKKEYLETLDDFLSTLDLPSQELSSESPQKIAAKL